MYEDLVARLRDYAAARKGEIAELTAEAADAIEELSKPSWIPVTERLPKKGMRVLCACRANILCVLKWDGIDWVENQTHVYMRGFVTHWMPLPEPPKEET